MIGEFLVSGFEAGSPASESRKPGGPSAFHKDNELCPDFGAWLVTGPQHPEANFTHDCE